MSNANFNATSRSAGSETHAEPKAEASTSAGTDMEIGVGDRRIRSREGGDSSRHCLDVSSDRGSMEEPRGEIPRRAEIHESVIPFSLLKRAHLRIPQARAAAASNSPIGERLYVNMIEEGPSGEYIMTVQRDRHGRWMPTKGERTTNVKKAREERRNFYVGGIKEPGTFSIASAEASPLHGEFFYLSVRNADEVSWKQLSTEDRTQFFKAIETEWQGVLDFKAVTIIDPTQSDVIRENQSE